MIREHLGGSAPSFPLRQESTAVAYRRQSLIFSKNPHAVTKRVTHPTDRGEMEFVDRVDLDRRNVGLSKSGGITGTSSAVGPLGGLIN
jgi:hypothetical protein